METADSVAGLVIPVGVICEIDHVDRTPARTAALAVAASFAADACATALGLRVKG